MSIRKEDLKNKLKNKQFDLAMSLLSLINFILVCFNIGDNDYFFENTNQWIWNIFYLLINNILLFE